MKTGHGISLELEGLEKRQLKKCAKQAEPVLTPLSFWGVASSKLRLGSQEQWTDISFSLEKVASIGPKVLFHIVSLLDIPGLVK